MISKYFIFKLKSFKWFPIFKKAELQETKYTKKWNQLGWNLESTMAPTNFENFDFEGNFSQSLFSRCRKRLLAQNLKRNWIRGKSNSNFERSQDFRDKKSELTRDFDTWSIFRAVMKEKLNGSNFELSQDPMHIPTCDLGSFDGFLSYLRVPPVQYQSYFWLDKIRRTLKSNRCLLTSAISRK